FATPGSYTFQVVIRDSVGHAVTSATSVTVDRKVNVVEVTPPAVTLPPGGAQELTITVRDQWGKPYASPPGVSIDVTGGGQLSSSPSGVVFTSDGTVGTFTVLASSQGVRGTAQIAVAGGSTTVTLGPVADAQVRSGKNATANFGTSATMEVKNTT